MNLPLKNCRTKRGVQLATLNVHEAMGQKVDREAVATLVLPQLWTMSMGPCTYPYLLVSSARLMVYYVVLNVSQFARFMRYA